MNTRLAATIASSASDFELCPLILPFLPLTAPLRDEVAQEGVEGGEGPLEVIRSFLEAIQHPDTWLQQRASTVGGVASTRP